MDREAVDRMILLGMDVDRYETQVIPDLQARVAELTQALKDLVLAVEPPVQDRGPATDVDAASARARQVLKVVKKG